HRKAPFVIRIRLSYRPSESRCLNSLSTDFRSQRLFAQAAPHCTYSCGLAWTSFAPVRNCRSSSLTFRFMLSAHDDTKTENRVLPVTLITYCFACPPCTRHCCKARLHFSNTGATMFRRGSHRAEPNPWPSLRGRGFPGVTTAPVRIE